MAVSYAVCDMQTGRILDWLPLELTEITRRVAAVDTVSAPLPVLDRTVPDDWAWLLNPATTLVVAVWEYDDRGQRHRTPVQAWYLPEADALRSDTPTLQLASCEGIFGRVYCDDYEVFDADYTDIAVALLGQKFTTGWGFTLHATPTGKLHSAAYSTFEDRTLAQVFEEFYDAGMEWTLRYDWTDAAQTHIAKAVELGPRIGAHRPDAVFDDGNAQATYKLSYTDTTGGVRTWVTGDGSGFSRQMSAVAEADDLLAAGVPPWELRRSYTNLEDEQHAARLNAELLGRVREGQQVWTLAGDADLAPRVGADWDLGDTIRVDFPPANGAKGLVGDLRAAGWKLGLQGNVPRTVTPLLPEEET